MAVPCHVFLLIVLVCTGDLVFGDTVAGQNRRTCNGEVASVPTANFCGNATTRNVCKNVDNEAQYSQYPQQCTWETNCGCIAKSCTCGDSPCIHKCIDACYPKLECDETANPVTCKCVVSPETTHVAGTTTNLQKTTSVLPETTHVAGPETTPVPTASASPETTAAFTSVSPGTTSIQDTTLQKSTSASPGTTSLRDTTLQTTTSASPGTTSLLDTTLQTNISASPGTTSLPDTTLQTTPPPSSPPAPGEDGGADSTDTTPRTPPSSPAPGEEGVAGGPRAALPPPQDPPAPLQFFIAKCTLVGYTLADFTDAQEGTLDIQISNYSAALSSLLKRSVFNTTVERPAGGSRRGMWEERDRERARVSENIKAYSPSLRRKSRGGQDNSGSGEIDECALGECVLLTSLVGLVEGEDELDVVTLLRATITATVLTTALHEDGRLPAATATDIEFRVFWDDSELKAAVELYYQYAAVGAGGLIPLVLLCLVRVRLMRACGCCGRDEEAAQEKTPSPPRCGCCCSETSSCCCSSCVPTCCASSSSSSSSCCCCCCSKRAHTNKVAADAWAPSTEEEEEQEKSMRGLLPCPPQLNFPWESTEVKHADAMAAAEAQADAIFALFDKDSSGLLSCLECEAGLIDLGFTLVEVAELFSRSDRNTDGSLSIEEFRAGVMPVLHERLGLVLQEKGGKSDNLLEDSFAKTPRALASLFPDAREVHYYSPGLLPPISPPKIKTPAPARTIPPPPALALAPLAPQQQVLAALSPRLPAAEREGQVVAAAVTRVTRGVVAPAGGLQGFVAGGPILLPSIDARSTRNELLCDGRMPILGRPLEERPATTNSAAREEGREEVPHGRGLRGAVDAAAAPAAAEAAVAAQAPAALEPDLAAGLKVFSPATPAAPVAVEDSYLFLVFDGGDMSVAQIKLKKSDASWATMKAAVVKQTAQTTYGLRYVDPQQPGVSQMVRNEEEWRRCWAVVLAEKDRELEVDLVRMPPIKPYKLAMKVDALKQKGEKKKIYYENIYDTPVTWRVQVDPGHTIGLLTVKEESLTVAQGDKGALILRFAPIGAPREETLLIKLKEEGSAIQHTVKVLATWS